MDISTLIMSVASSIGASIAAVSWFVRQWVGHRLAKDLERFKAEWQRDLEMQKAVWQGEVRKDVESYLGERAADREYQLEARKRLYHAIGSLRFQLLMACKEAAARIEVHGLRSEYSMSMKGPYGRSSLYRVLRPIAISELIERQMAYADFAVDPAAVQILRLKQSAFTAFSDGSIILEHPNADWRRQKEHVFSQNLGRAANGLIVEAEPQARVLNFHEFDLVMDNPIDRDRFSPLSDILDDFRISHKPIFWLRLVCFGYLCREAVGSMGTHIGFQYTPYPVVDLLKACPDDYVQGHVAEFEQAFRACVAESL